MEEGAFCNYNKKRQDAFLEVYTKTFFTYNLQIFELVGIRSLFGPPSITFICSSIIFSFSTHSEKSIHN